MNKVENSGAVSLKKLIKLRFLNACLNYIGPKGG